MINFLTDDLPAGDRNMITRNRKAPFSFPLASPGVLASLLFLGTGCAVTPPQAPPQAAAPPTETVYVVQKGDTLEKIARNLTGDAKNASALAQSNALRRQHHLDVGQRLVIPASMHRTSSAASDRETPVPQTTPDATPEAAASPVPVSAGLPAEAAPVVAALGQVLMGGVFPQVLAQGSTHHAPAQQNRQDQQDQRNAAQSKVALSVLASGVFPQALAVQVVHQAVREGLRQAQEDGSPAQAPPSPDTAD